MAIDGGWRRILTAAAWMPMAVTAVVLAGVIPAVKADVFPRAVPDRAAMALLVMAAIHGALGWSLLAAARREDWRRRRIAMAGVAMILALLLMDAATAFAEHGPGMRTATLALFGCSAADFAAGVLVVFGVFARHGAPRRIDLVSAG